MPLETLPGVGSSMSHKLKEAGLNNCGDVQQVSLARLEMVLGKKLAQNLHYNCRGIDPRSLTYEQVGYFKDNSSFGLVTNGLPPFQARKTVSAEMNFGIRFTKAIECEQFLRQLSDEVTKRLIEVKRKTKSVNLKIMVRAAEAPVETSKYMGHGVCDVVNKTTGLKHATDDVNVITSIVLSMMKEANLPFHELRGLGIHLNKLEDVGEVRKENILKDMFVKISEKRTRYPLQLPTKEQPAVEVKAVPEVEPKAKTRKGKSVINMLKAASEAKKQPPIEDKKECAESGSPPRDSNIVDVAPNEIDPDVLAQLPEDIRREVLNNKYEYLLMENDNGASTRNPRKRCFSPTPADEPVPPSNTSPLNASDLRPSTSRAGQARLQKRKRATARKVYENGCRSDQIVADYIEELPKYTHPAILQYINRSPEEVPLQEEDYKTTPDYRQEEPVCKLLLEGDYKTQLNVWVSNEVVPLPTDVDMIHDRICNLVRADNLNLMYDVMRHLCRYLFA